MHYLTEKQIQAIAAEQLAAEIADAANRLQRMAADHGMVLEIVNVADLFGVVLVRPIATHHETDCHVPVN